MEDRRCGTCGCSFPDTDEYFAPSLVGSSWEECRSCQTKGQVLRRYNISIGDWQALFDKQQGKCAICGIHQCQLNITLAIDHDHLTGKVRGLLCTKCNTGLGMFVVDEKKTDLLKKAIKYIE